MMIPERSDSGIALVMVIIYSLVMTTIGMAIIYLNNAQEIATRQEIATTRALYLADAGIETAKAFIVGLGDFNGQFPEEFNPNLAASELRHETLEPESGGYRPEGEYIVRIYPFADNDVPNVGNYLVVSTGTVTFGEAGTTDVRKVQHAVIRARKQGANFSYRIVHNSFREFPLERKTHP